MSRLATITAAATMITKSRSGKGFPSASVSGMASAAASEIPPRMPAHATTTRSRHTGSPRARLNSRAVAGPDSIHISRDAITTATTAAITATPSNGGMPGTQCTERTNSMPTRVNSSAFSKNTKTSRNAKACNRAPGANMALRCVPT
jgi:hypothetical protein